MAKVNKSYRITLSNVAIPFHDDSAFDVPSKTFWTKDFTSKNEAYKFFREYVKENNMIRSGNMAENQNTELYMIPMWA